jgi:lipoyl(octanoyl) transferase
MKLEDWGLIEYEASSLKQTQYVDEIAAGTREETIVFCAHPPVVTLGRATREGDLAGWTGAVSETSRGGRATYHGPNQQVIYPILDLRRAHANFGERDVHAYLRALENATVAVLREAGLPDAEARTTKQGEDSLTGVWTGTKKIASIGIAVRKWITYHGVAINLLDDPSAHQGIKPCGFTSNIMTSLEGELGRKIDMPSVSALFQRVFKSHLS